MQIFCKLRDIPIPKGVKKITSNEQNVPTYYMLNRPIRDILFYCIFLYHLTIKMGTTVKYEIPQRNNVSRIGRSTDQIGNNSGKIT